VTLLAAAASAAVLAVLVGVWLAVRGVNALRARNSPSIVPNDLEAALARVARRSIEIAQDVSTLENRLIKLEHRETEREAQLADALQRYERMTKRLTMRADRQRPAQDETETGDLAAVIARRNGIR
jgi:septal ring factor EnvC (AmiA/AmiB activator)